MNILNFIKNKFKPTPKYKVSGKGQYLMKYILDVYINENHKDYIQEYEDIIEKRCQTLEKENTFKKISEYYNIPKEDIDNSFKHHFSALHLFGILISVLEKEEQEKIFNNIKDDDLKIFIKFLIGE